jgi:HTH-type transcriptional regulator/antitoxin HigA
MNKEDIICPGDTIKEYLEIYNYTQKDLSEKLNMKLKTVNQILNGNAVITVDTAIKLSIIFNVSASFWNKLEFNYRKKLKELENQTNLEQEYEVIKPIYKEMILRNLVPDTKDKFEKVNNVKKFMEVTSITQIYNEYEKITCKKQEIKNNNIINLMIWIQCGIKKTRGILDIKFDKEKLLSNIENIKSLTIMENQDIAREKLKRICLECGIILEYEKMFANTDVNGIAKWLTPNKAFIQISDKNKRVDTFWFAFMHGIGHILLDNKKEIYLDINIDSEEVEDRDSYANNFAKNKLINLSKYNKFIKDKNIHDFTKKNILEFSKSINISPDIVTNRIKYDFCKKYNKEIVYKNSVLKYFDRKLDFNRLKYKKEENEINLSIAENGEEYNIDKY